MRRSTSAETAAAFRASYERRMARRRLTPEERAERLRLEAERVVRREARLQRRRERAAALLWAKWLRTPAGRQLRCLALNLAAAMALQVTENPRWREEARAG